MTEAKRCKHCGKIIHEHNKSGLCNHCYNVNYIYTKVLKRKCPHENKNKNR